jgi:hypothetical protein
MLQVPAPASLSQSPTETAGGLLQQNSRVAKGDLGPDSQQQTCSG